ncbi:MAG TPA: ABC transporter permease [Vicinamibacteria bacterium]|nr:ABC transporter permease [Vicinamibacteria bacterium]
MDRTTAALAQDEVGRLTRDLEIRVREVEQLNHDVAELTHALRVRGGEVEELNRTVERLSGGLAAREAEVRRLNADVARMSEGLQTREDEVRRLNAEVDRLARDLEARGREVEELNRKLAALPAPTPPPAVPPPLPRVTVAPRVTRVRKRDLLGAVWTIVRTDLKVRYHGSLGGFVWTLLKPLSMLAVLLAVFSFIFARSPDYALNLIVGLFLWDYFVEGTRVGLVSLAAKGYLLAKTRFPRWILVVTSSASALLTAVVFAGALMVVLAAAHRPPGAAAVLLVALYLLQLALIVAGFSLAASVLFLRYRDLDQVWEVATHAGFFLAPIVYPLSILPERFHFWLYLWPPTPVIQYARSVLVAGVVPSARAHLLLAAVTASMLVAGTLVFRRFAPDAAEQV